MVDEYCDGCIYKTNFGSVLSSEKMCAYILITGKSRSLICKSGDGCTAKKEKALLAESKKKTMTEKPEQKEKVLSTPKKQIARNNGVEKNRKEPMIKKPKYDIDGIRKMAENGMSDREIGEKIGLGSNGVWHIRKQNNIPAGIKPLTKADIDAIREMVAQGMNDREIGEKLGKSSRAICDYRHKHNIKAAIKPVGGWKKNEGPNRKSRPRQD